MSQNVHVLEVAARPTLVVGATTTWQEFPRLWQELSAEVWGCLRAAGINRGCPNVMLYLDDRPQVEVGVLLDQPCPLTGRVVRSALPSGHVATVVHTGPYSRLGDSHRAVLDWCTEQGLATAGPRWEIYGPHRDDPAELTTEISYLISPTS
jgi:effector-binding domain-containing protein